jgi:hypothetical protein
MSFPDGGWLVGGFTGLFISLTASERVQAVIQTVGPQVVSQGQPSLVEDKHLNSARSFRESEEYLPQAFKPFDGPTRYVCISSELYEGCNVHVSGG